MDQQPKPETPRSNTLALLYQSIITGIVRLQAKRQNLTDPVTFRRRIKDALEDVRRDSAAGIGHGNGHPRPIRGHYAQRTPSRHRVFRIEE